MTPEDAMESDFTDQEGHPAGQKNNLKAVTFSQLLRSLLPFEIRPHNKFYHSETPLIDLRRPYTVPYHKMLLRKGHCHIG